MSLQEFRSYVESRGVDFDGLNDDKKGEWRERFDRCRALQSNPPSDEQPRKRSRSIEVVKSFIEQFPDIYEELEDSKKYIIALQVKLLQKEESLNKAQQTVFSLQSMIKSTIQSGSMTITRSIFEIYLKDYENKLWNSLTQLGYVLYGSNDSTLDCFNATLLYQNLYENTDGHHNEIDSQYRNDVDNIIFLFKLRGVKGQERKQLIMMKISEEIEIVNNIPNCSKAGESEIRKALGNIYSTLSNEVHQSAMRFEGDTIILPKVSKEITLADIYAVATIVNQYGFAVQYPLE